jgi:prepilin-type N-terminal cleavage/methylation domain-containing protein
METLNKKGFSLIELLVVISIIATLSAILLPNLMGARDRATDSARIGDMGAIKNSLRLYYNDVQAYPTGTGVTLGSGMSSYMPSITGLGYTYGYYQLNNGDGFELRLNLISGQGDDDINSQKRCGISSQTEKLYVVCAN